MTKSSGGHEAILHFQPPFPDITSLAGSDAGGTLTLDIDSCRPVIVGRWRTNRVDEQTENISLDITTGWRPQGLPLLMKLVTTALPVFRHWPETYRWEAIVTLLDDRPPTVKAHWERMGSDRGESYQAFTGGNAHKKRMH